MRKRTKLTILLIFSIFFLIISFSHVDAAPNNVSSCRPVFLSGEYLLNNDISFSGLIDCFFINVSDVLFDCNGFEVIGQDITYGININNRTNVTIKNCNLKGFGYSVFINGGNETYIINNTLNYNTYGMRIQDSFGNNIINNIMEHNSQAGIVIVSGLNNIIYNNTFGNPINVVLAGEIGTNSWNTTSLGNSWNLLDNKGHSQLCLDENNDNICDSNYTIKENNTDYFPLKSYIIYPIYSSSSKKKAREEPVGKNYSISEFQLNAGYNKIHYLNDKLNFKMNGESHSLSIENISSNFVSIIIQSTPQQASLLIGETKLFSLTEGWYNLSVTLNGITREDNQYKVNLTILNISQSIFPSQQENIQICNESWICEEWNKCSKGVQSRFCFDSNNCNSIYNQPSLEQNCENKFNIIRFISFILLLSILIILAFLVRIFFSKKSKNEKI